MSDPISFTSTSARYALPLLFAGQSQKEFFVNEAHSRTDMLLHPSVIGEASVPPANPGNGDCWLVGDSASGAWAGHEDDLACYQSGNWLFAAPRPGLTIYDQAAGQIRLYVSGWQAASPVPAPANGSVVDTEARNAVNGLIAALIAGGVLPSS